MALLGLEPEWVYPTRTEEERLIGQLDPQQVEKQLDALLQKGEEVCAVYVTSPDYFGVMSDIRAQRLPTVGVFRFWWTTRTVRICVFCRRKRCIRPNWEQTCAVIRCTKQCLP